MPSVFGISSVTGLTEGRVGQGRRETKLKTGDTRRKHKTKKKHKKHVKLEKKRSKKGRGR